MDFYKENKNDVTIITVNLEKAILTHAEKFRKYLLEIVEKAEKRIVIDLSKSKYIDSTFLGTLVICFKKINAEGFDTKIVCNEKVKFIICEITKLSNVFSVYETKEEAISSFAVEK